MRLFALACFALALPSDSPAQTLSPLARVEALELDTLRIGRVRAYAAPIDTARATELATLTENAAAFFERELGVSFPIHLAVLDPQSWFVPQPGGEHEPYGIPWAWVEDLLIGAPASLEVGVLISGPDPRADRRRVSFVLLHEFGHLASKRYLHPDSDHPYSAVWWFEEFLATYWAYAYIAAQDPDWARVGAEEWAGVLEAFTPSTLSLDWSFMRRLEPQEFARTYAWYQMLLNLRAAQVHARHGIGFLRDVREGLHWDESDRWTTNSLLPDLEAIAPGFQTWADSVETGRVGSGE